MHFNRGLVFFVLFLVCSMVPVCAVQLQNNFNGDLKDYNMFEGNGGDVSWGMICSYWVIEL